jgi:hypothetical protein
MGLVEITELLHSSLVDSRARLKFPRAAVALSMLPCDAL